MRQSVLNRHDKAISIHNKRIFCDTLAGNKAVRVAPSWYETLSESFVRMVMVGVKFNLPIY